MIRKTMLTLLALFIFTIIFYPSLSSAAQSAGSDEITILVGNVEKYDTGKQSLVQSYSITSGGEKIKIIGPRAILEQIINIPEFEKLNFKLKGKIIKKDNKKGILLDSFEVAGTPGKDGKPAESPVMVAPGSSGSEPVELNKK